MYTTPYIHVDIRKLNTTHKKDKTTTNTMQPTSKTNLERSWDTEIPAKTWFMWFELDGKKEALNNL